MNADHPIADEPIKGYQALEAITPKEAKGLLSAEGLGERMITAFKLWIDGKGIVTNTTVSQLLKSSAMTTDDLVALRDKFEGRVEQTGAELKEASGSKIKTFRLQLRNIYPQKMLGRVEGEINRRDEEMTKAHAQKVLQGVAGLQLHPVEDLLANHKGFDKFMAQLIRRTPSYQRQQMGGEVTGQDFDARFAPGREREMFQRVIAGLDKIISENPQAFTKAKGDDLSLPVWSLEHAPLSEQLGGELKSVLLMMHEDREKRNFVDGKATRVTYDTGVTIIGSTRYPEGHVQAGQLERHKQALITKDKGKREGHSLLRAGAGHLVHAGVRQAGAPLRREGTPPAPAVTGDNFTKAVTKAVKSMDTGRGQETEATKAVDRMVKDSVTTQHMKNFKGAMATALGAEKAKIREGTLAPVKSALLRAPMRRLERAESLVAGINRPLERSELAERRDVAIKMIRAFSSQRKQLMEKLKEKGGRLTTTVASDILSSSGTDAAKNSEAIAQLLEAAKKAAGTLDQNNPGPYLDAVIKELRSQADGYRGLASLSATIAVEPTAIDWDAIKATVAQEEGDRVRQNKPPLGLGDVLDAVPRETITTTSQWVEWSNDYREQHSLEDALNAFRDDVKAVLKDEYPDVPVAKRESESAIPWSKVAERAAARDNDRVANGLGPKRGRQEWIARAQREGVENIKELYDFMRGIQEEQKSGQAPLHTIDGELISSSDRSIWLARDQGRAERLFADALRDTVGNAPMTSEHVDIALAKAQQQLTELSDASRSAVAQFSQVITPMLAEDQALGSFAKRLADDMNRLADLLDKGAAGTLTIEERGELTRLANAVRQGAKLGKAAERKLKDNPHAEEALAVLYDGMHLLEKNRDLQQLKYAGTLQQAAQRLQASVDVPSAEVLQNLAKALRKMTKPSPTGATPIAEAIKEAIPRSAAALKVGDDQTEVVCFSAAAMDHLQGAAQKLKESLPKDEPRAAQ